jgi:hypothetical protein
MNLTLFCATLFKHCILYSIPNHIRRGNLGINCSLAGEFVREDLCGKRSMGRLGIFPLEAV